MVWWLAAWLTSWLMVRLRFQANYCTLTADADDNDDVNVVPLRGWWVNSFIINLMYWLLWMFHLAQPVMVLSPPILYLSTNYPAGDPSDDVDGIELSWVEKELLKLWSINLRSHLHFPFLQHLQWGQPSANWIQWFGECANAIITCLELELQTWFSNGCLAFLSRPHFNVPIPCTPCCLPSPSSS